jgi:hypothetical protein
MNISDNLQSAIAALEELQNGQIYNEEIVAPVIRLLQRTKYAHDESNTQRFRNVIRKIRESKTKNQIKA